jgi:hypothetical protein
VTKGHLTPLWILYQELVIKKGMSYEKVANAINIALNRLPYMEILYEQVSRAVRSKEERSDYLDLRISTLEAEERRLKRRIVTLPPSSYNYVDTRNNPTMNPFSYYRYTPRQPSPLPYWPSGYPDLSKEYYDEDELNIR